MEETCDTCGRRQHCKFVVEWLTGKPHTPPDGHRCDEWEPVEECVCEARFR
jgi:hypothetical protein